MRRLRPDHQISALLRFVEVRASLHRHASSDCLRLAFLPLSVFMVSEERPAPCSPRSLLFSLLPDLLCISQRVVGEDIIELLQRFGAESKLPEPQNCVKL